MEVPVPAPEHVDVLVQQPAPVVITTVVPKDAEVSSGISEEHEEAFETLLEDVENGRFEASDGAAIKSRLHELNIEESDAIAILKLMRLQEGCPESVEKLFKECSIFAPQRRRQSVVSEWIGAVHSIELLDETVDPPKSWFVFSPCIPQAGETIEPENGTTMVVVKVAYRATSDKSDPTRPILAPVVYVRPDENGKIEGHSRGRPPKAATPSKPPAKGKRKKG